MAYRYTDTGKWGDSWFVDLNPKEKLLFLYLCDNCDIAGFCEISYRRISFDTGIEERGLQGALKGLARCLIFSYDGEVVFLRNFLKHQKNLPLNRDNKAHRGAIKRLEKYADKFDLKAVGEALKTDLFALLEIEITEGKESSYEGALKGDDSPIQGASKGLQSPTGININNNINNNIFNYKAKKEEKKGKEEKQAKEENSTALEIVEVVEEVDPFNDFENWIRENAPEVGKMKDPFTQEQYERLFADYNAEDIYNTLESMHNWTQLHKKCRSANLTCRNWIRRDSEQKGPVSNPKRNGSSKVGILDRINAAVQGALVDDNTDIQP
ncbi:hypothetical protein ACR75N_04710 [Parabacteroides merdae]|uniref:hypothetical protein n=1 Tax=Parabacteroides merdae TaxID=46503 RepID=UPI003DA4D943